MCVIACEGEERGDPTSLVRCLPHTPTDILTLLASLLSLSLSCTEKGEKKALWTATTHQRHRWRHYDCNMELTSVAESLSSLVREGFKCHASVSLRGDKIPNGA